MLKSYISKFIEDSSYQQSTTAKANYMNVIRESPRLREQRQQLKDKREVLMRMEFDTTRDAGRQRSQMVSFINQFMNERSNKSRSIKGAKRIVQSLYKQII